LWDPDVASGISEKKDARIQNSKWNLIMLGLDRIRDPS
jgi:hypothetical protein